MLLFTAFCREKFLQNKTSPKFSIFEQNWMIWLVVNNWSGKQTMETLYQLSTVRPSPFNMNVLTLPISYFSVVFLICIQPSKPFVALMCSKCWCQWLPWFKAIIFSSQLSSAHNFFHLLRIKFKLNAVEISYESTHFLHILIWKKNLN